MYFEAHYTGKDEVYVDRLVAMDEQEDMRMEAVFMIGAGVNCRRTATDYSDPLQEQFPRTYSPEATETIVKGAYKALYGPKAGYWVIDPNGARKLLGRTLLERQSVVPFASVILDEADQVEAVWAHYGERNQAN